MKRNTLFSILATAAFGIVMAGPVTATDKTFTPAAFSGVDDWNTAGNWSPSGVPADGDKVIIPAGKTAQLNSGNDGRCDSFAVADTGFIEVTGKTLEIDSDSSVAGTDGVKLTDATAVLLISVDLTLSGDGSIKGQHNDAKIQIEGGDTLTSNMLIHGQMTVETNGGSGNGTFLNGSTGIVRADADGGTIQMASGLTLDDASGASWEAVGTAGFTTQPVLQFKQAANLAGDFVLCGDAKLDFDAAIDTTGCFDESAANGEILVAGTEYFCYDDDDCAGESRTGNCWSSDHEFSGSCN